MARRSRRYWLSWPAASVIEFVRSTPLLIQVYFLFYVLPSYGLNMTALVAGTLGIALHYACYTAEVYRAGLDSVPRGQWEAVTALNLSPWKAYRDVILPQAIRPIVPALGNYLIAMFKDTPVLSAITVVEIMQQAKNIGSESFRYLEPITLVGLFFLTISIVLAFGVRQVESRTALR
ncbi:putative glutamine ABC transporter permease protein GlnM [compost metagenome]